MAAGLHRQQEGLWPKPDTKYGYATAKSKSERTDPAEHIHVNVFGVYISHMVVIILYLFVLPSDVFIRVLAMSPFYNASYNMYVLRRVRGDDKRGINNTIRGSIYTETNIHIYIDQNSVRMRKDECWNANAHIYIILVYI